MLIASVLVVAGFILIQGDSGDAEHSARRLFYAARLIGAILTATVIPLLIDRRARRSSRISR
jgi:hypothetical protein